LNILSAVAVIVVAELNFPFFQRAIKRCEMLESIKFMKGKRGLFPGKK
jgi:hypothetical protein